MPWRRAWRSAYLCAVASRTRGAKIHQGRLRHFARTAVGGAMLTTVPNYRLWVDEVNKAGGLMLKKWNKRIPIEVMEIDDRSNNEDMVRLVERLMTVDKVDIVLSPWGTGPNLQAAPVFAKNGYPQLVGTGNSDKIPELVQRFPT